MDFTEKLRLRERAEENIYFAELDRQLIKKLHEQQRMHENQEQSLKQLTEQNDLHLK